MISEIKKEYLEGASLTKLALKYGISRQTISRHLKKDGVQISNLQNSTTIIENYFEVIDTEDKAYWLGFMYADGYVADKTNHIELSLKISDNQHLVKFANCINFTNPIILDSYRCRICFANVKMKKDLIFQGCFPRKSLILKPTFNVPDDLKRHFIRGYFEGDGCISLVKDKNHRCNVSILGTYDMLSWIDTNTLNLNKKLRKNSKGNDITLVYELSGVNAYNFLEMIYKESNIFLNRKYEKYQIYKDARHCWETMNESGKIGRKTQVENTEVSTISAVRRA